MQVKMSEVKPGQTVVTQVGLLKVKEVVVYPPLVRLVDENGNEARGTEATPVQVVGPGEQLSFSFYV